MVGNLDYPYAQERVDDELGAQPRISHREPDGVPFLKGGRH